MSGHAKGGNDSFTASGCYRQLPHIFYGDAGGDMFGFAHGGDDVAVLPTVNGLPDPTRNAA